MICALQIYLRNGEVYDGFTDATSFDQNPESRSAFAKRDSKNIRSNCRSGSVYVSHKPGPTCLNFVTGNATIAVCEVDGVATSWAGSGEGEVRSLLHMGRYRPVRGDKEARSAARAESLQQLTGLINGGNGIHLDNTADRFVLFQVTGDGIGENDTIVGPRFNVSNHPFPLRRTANGPVLHGQTTPAYHRNAAHSDAWFIAQEDS
jgi:hypothetical protein